MHKFLKDEVISYLERDCDELVANLLHKEWNIDRCFIRNELIPLIKEINEEFSNNSEEETFKEGYSVGFDDAVKEINHFDPNGDARQAYKNWKKK
mgnify:CR=1 FL=1